MSGCPVYSLCVALFVRVFMLRCLFDVCEKIVSVSVSQKAEIERGHIVSTTLETGHHVGSCNENQTTPGTVFQT